MSTIKIKKGLDIKLEGAPAPDIVDALRADAITVYPQEFEGIRPRLKVKEGDAVKKGSVLFFDKKNEAFQFRSPAGGTIQSIVLGARRAIDQIIINVARDEEVESLKSYQADKLLSLSREEIVAHLLDTGYLALIKQRPFSKMADPNAQPKAIFVNGMHTAPFQPDPNIIIKGHESSFQAGLNLLSRLTDGKVHLCVDEHATSAWRNVQHATVHTFSGPHPAGNTSVHIHFLNPIKPGETVWTASVSDVMLLGQLFTEGVIPSTKIISVGGTGVVPSARKYYRVRQGGSLNAILKGNLQSDEQRVIAGDVLSGKRIEADSSVRFYGSSLNVIPEGRTRYFMGWMTPGLSQYSYYRLFLSRWFKRNATWPLNSNRHGSLRAMVMTGLYDKLMPMQIMVDFLIRAVLAHDTDEAIKLGILETDPEDFALCAFICPSKIDVCGIIKQGLKEIEEEGL